VVDLGVGEANVCVKVPIQSETDGPSQWPGRR
jgi:hypothetical protein